ncbi:hypothetical protein B0H17DRAFT_601907 [Mycena rosella]|uniref:BRCT domain-containing protein n=1 Tax=Mycena rosella TaxID=1033263 RepID=A0AAD7DGL0_MYCRO|nr:hypothetical protein B0H17DRAFT_601907 [Mycena rosella]
MMFDGVKYHLPSTLPHDRQLYLTALLTQHNATRADSIFDATHIITNTDALRFEGWQEMDSENIAVVRELWVERSIAAGKMQKTSFYSASRSKIFSGVVACSADLPLSDEEVLSNGITNLGGQWRMNLTKDVTHLFAASSTSEKYRTGMSYRDQTHIKVLVPDWFDDTILLGLPDLSTEIYQWPDPVVLTQRMNPTTQLKHSKKSNVWEGCRILLSTSLALTGSRRKIVEDGIRQAQGVPIAYISEDDEVTSEEEVRLLDDCDIFVTRYRAGLAFFKAWRKGKKIGTLNWLLDVQASGVQSSPLDQILHFPIPPGAIVGFEKHEISITNYTGESREYLKKLITLMGGNFTPYLSVKATILVAAQLSGPKMTKAAEWSIPIVNHTWLEDCFLRWQNVTPTLPKYTSYPTSIDFATTLDQIGMGPDIAKTVAAEVAKGGETSSSNQGADHKFGNAASHAKEISGTSSLSNSPVPDVDEAPEIIQKPKGRVTKSAKRTGKQARELSS